MLRVIQTSLRGYERLAAMTDRDACLDLRMRSLMKRVRVWGCMLPAVARHAVNDKERQAALDLDRRVREVLPPTTAERAKRVAVLALAARWKLRVKLMGDMIQPDTIVTRFRAGRAPSVRDDARTGRTTGAEQGLGKLTAAARVAGTA
jgi:hypothetical protein